MALRPTEPADPFEPDIHRFAFGIAGRAVDTGQRRLHGGIVKHPPAGTDIDSCNCRRSVAAQPQVQFDLTFHSLFPGRVRDCRRHVGNDFGHHRRGHVLRRLGRGLVVAVERGEFEAERLANPDRKIAGTLPVLQARTAPDKGDNRGIVNSEW